MKPQTHSNHAAAPLNRWKILAMGVILAGALALGISFWFSTSGEKSGHYPVYPVHLKVDFGVAGKEGFDDEIFVEKNMTAVETVAQVYPVLLGKACCSLKEIMEIGGTRIDPLKNHWWEAYLNGSKKFSPRKYHLKKGDSIEWKYVGLDQ